MVTVRPFSSPLKEKSIYIETEAVNCRKKRIQGQIISTVDQQFNTIIQCFCKVAKYCIFVNFAISLCLKCPPVLFSACWTPTHLSRPSSNVMPSVTSTPTLQAVSSARNKGSMYVSVPLCNINSPLHYFYTWLLSFGLCLALLCIDNVVTFSAISNTMV